MNPKLYAKFQKTNPEQFNENIVYMRNNESVHSYFEDLFKTLNLAGIKFLSSRTIKDETEHAKYIPKNNLRIESNRLDLIEAKFQLSHLEETKEVTIYLFYPKLIDNFFFQLNGNKFFAIYQLTDRNFYSVSRGIFLKTLLMPLGVKVDDFKPTNKAEELELLPKGKVLRLDFFKTKISRDKSLKNILFYFYIKFGFSATLKYLGLNKDIEVYDTKQKKDSSWVEFSKCSSIFVYYKKTLCDSPNKNNILCTFLSSIYDVKKHANLELDTYWKRKILTTTSTNAKLEKADKAMFSLERVLDERTKKNLKEVPTEDKKDVYGVLKYMMFNYNEIYDLDTVDIYNRRIRLTEYLIFPLLTKFSDLSYRMLNSRNIDMKRLETVFSNIGSMFIIKKLVKNELLRYSNGTNALELFSVGLRFSCRGPQSLGTAGGNTLIKFRGLHPSYKGNISLVTSSASDPGLSSTLNPFSTNLQDMFFERDSNNVDS